MKLKSPFAEIIPLLVRQLMKDGSRFYLLYLSSTITFSSTNLQAHLLLLSEFGFLLPFLNRRACPEYADAKERVNAHLAPFGDLSRRP